MTIAVQRAGSDDYGTKIKMLVVGDSGSGKTRHSSCWPDPLILSAEDGLMSVADRQTPNIPITSTAQITEAIGLLALAPDGREQQLGVPVRTVVVDTIDEVARLFIRERLKSERKEAMAIQDWGWLGEQLRQIVRALRNLDMHVIFNVHAKSQEDSDTGRTFVKPGIQGAMGDEIAGYVDIAVLLKARPVVKVVNGNNVREIQRFMQTYPDPVHTWVKDRSGRLPMEFPINFNDDYERIEKLLFAGIAEAREKAKAKQVEDLQQMQQEVAPKSVPVPPAPEPEPVVIPDPAPAPERVEPEPEIVPEPEPAPEPEPEPKPEPEPEKPKAKKAPAAKKAAPEAEAVPDAGTPVAAPERHPDGTYDDAPDAVESDCPRGYGCIVDKDMADLSYIRFRKKLCRSCFVEAKKK